MKKILIALGVLIGFALILYPLVSQIYYDQISESEVEEFQRELANIDPPELKTENVKLAEAFNEALDPNLGWVDPYTDEERAEGLAEYAQMLEVKEKIGILTIGKIDVQLPVYAGTSDSVLDKGVGHLEGTSLPVGGENTHSVLTAHRGLAEARLFRDLDQLEVGDVFFIETMAGDMYYEVDLIQVVEPTDTDTVMIVPGEDYMTLLTCTPYMVNSHRLLVRGTRIEKPTEAALVEDEVEKDLAYYAQNYWQYLAGIVVALIIVVVVVRKTRNGKTR